MGLDLSGWVVVALKKMPQKVFEITIQLLALAAAIKLLF